jgi:alkanesulfonate monooxygenase SsuD/methylene tetrahydromethanopterin reductase-like flavin-dependent oxidoreductase (luciferase family)
MKVYTASITPASIRNSAEIADGMIPVFMDPQRFELFEPHLNAGFAKTGNRRSLATYDICPFVPVSMGDNIEEARLPIKQHLALYVGGMGRARKISTTTTQSASATKPMQSASRMPSSLAARQRQSKPCPMPWSMRSRWSAPPTAFATGLQVWKDAGKRRHVDSMLLSDNVSIEALQVIAEAVL